MSGALHGVLASLKSAAAAATDTFFKYVSLLLNTTSTNGAQNNTFLDSSTNNFSITRNGNTTQGTFSPFSQTGWSNYFDGTGDTLSVAQTTAMDLGSGNFTIETWIYPTSFADYRRILAKQRASDGFGYVFRTNITTGYLYFEIDTSGIVTSTAAPALNTWSHVCVVRNSNTVTIYLNGISVGSASYSGSPTSVSASALIGSHANTDEYFVGYLSNMRFVKGTAVYTANFTPPTSPLTNITNTSLLTCQSNRFIDNSSNAFAITRNGDVSVQAFSPFNPTAAWSAGTNGGSGYFDGTGDYLSIADSATIRFGTGTFTIQGWVYRNAAGATHTIAAKGGASTGWVLQITSTNVLRFTDTTTNIDTTTTIPASTWTHVAVVRTGTGASGLKLYINAVDSATGTSSTNFNQTDALNIGADRSNANAFNGYIASLKYTVGTAESISVPTAPATGGTVLLNFTNAGIFDSASGNDLETVGNAQVSTTVAKWGTTSMAFDGTGDWLTALNRPSLNIGTGDFTIELWVNRTASASGSGNADAVISKGTNNIVLTIDVNTAKFTFGQYGVASLLTSTTVVSNSTWYHVAITRSGTTLRMFVGGMQEASTTSSANFTSTTSMFIGADVNNTNQRLNGYIDDLRITNGYARYTANFTAPTAAFPLN